MKFRAIHKSASVLHEKICLYINMYSAKEVVDFDRLWTEDFRMNWEDTYLDDPPDIIVLRNPVNRIISMYYSYGWSHPPELRPEDFLDYRKEIREQTLGEFICKKKILTNEKHFIEGSLKLGSTILRYEDIMDNPEDYLHFILKSVDRLDLIESVKKEFLEEFEWTKQDLSDKIVKGEITYPTAHKRNLDHYEYLHKLSHDQIEYVHNILDTTLEKYWELPCPLSKSK